MHWFDGFRLSVRRRWDRVDATFVDSRYDALKLYDSDGSSGSYQIYEYMVDVPGRDGGSPVRLTFKEKSYKVRNGLKRGTAVPVVVNAKRTKAMFNLADPRVDQDGLFQAQQRERKEHDDARFEALRRDRPQ
ncbi:hypothetical protein OJ998_19690 [Solirubrobacter taibaiensis]|nr:hypothetical protein [Solirubrobacter taibaiensis]